MRTVRSGVGKSGSVMNQRPSHLQTDLPRCPATGPSPYQVYVGQPGLVRPQLWNITYFHGASGSRSVLTRSHSLASCRPPPGEFASPALLFTCSWRQSRLGWPMRESFVFKTILHVHGVAQCWLRFVPRVI